MGRRVYENSILVTGDASGGLRALRLTDQELAKVEKTLTRTNRSNRQFGEGLKRSTGGFLDFRAAALSVTSVGLASYFFKSADTIKNIDARLRIVTSSTKEFSFAQSELFRISQETFASLDSTARLYTRMQQSLGDLSVTQSELLRVTAATNQAFAVSGANAAEANAAIIQLTQGLASGQLRGEEFRSIAEQATRILQILQDELGKTRGELIKMAHAGELTSDLVIEAMLNQSHILQSEFDKLPLTIDRAFTTANNNILSMIGDFDRATNATGILAEAIVLLSESLDEIALFVGIGVLAKLGGMMARAAVSANQYRVAFGAAQTATLGLGLAVTKLNKAFSLLGGVWGIALFAGFEFFSWLADRESDLTRFSDEYTESMAAVKKATEDGFSVEDVDTFKQGIVDSQAEVRRLTSEIARLSQVRDQQSFDENAFYAFDLQGSAGLAALSANSEKAGRDVEKLKEKMNELNESINQQIDYLRRSDESFSLADEAVIRYTTAVQSADVAQSLLSTTWGFARSALTELIKTQEQADKTIESWLLKAGAQSDKLKEQIATFGQSKSQILEYQIAQIDTTNASQDMKDAFAALSSELVKQTKHLEDLEKKQKTQAKLAKEREKRLEKEAKLRKNRLDEFRKNQKEAVAELDPLQGVVDDFAGKFSNLWETVGAGDISIGEAVTGLDNLISQMIRQAGEIENVDNKMDALLAEYQREIEITRAVGDEKLRLMAQRELEQQGIAATTQRVDELVKKWKELKKAQQEGSGGFLGQFGGVFDTIINGLEDSLSNTLTNIGGQLMAIYNQDPDAPGAGATRGVAFGAAGIGAYLSARESGLDAGGGILKAGQAILAMIPGWGQAIAAVMEVVDKISGGKLFGTAFETTGGATSFTIDETGGSGFSQTFRERQRSFFRGREFETITNDLPAEAQAALVELFDTIQTTIASSSQALGLEVGEMITGSFAQEYDADGNLVKEASTVLGRTFEETFEQFGRRLLGENIIAQVDRVLPQIERTFTRLINIGDREVGDFFIEQQITEMVGQASAIAERWRHNADLLLEGSQLLLAAATDWVNDSGLLDNMEEIVDITELNQQAGEQLIETYSRIYQENFLINESFALMGVNVGLAGKELVQFNIDVVKAMGGLDAASQSISNYFELFYTEQELANARLINAATNRDEALNQIGLEPSIALADFREQFEAVASTLNPEELANWFAASNALHALNQEMQSLVAAEQEYLDFINGFRAELVQLSGTDYQNELAGLRFALQDNIAQANQLAQAAGRAGASTEDLAVIQSAYVANTEALTARLRNQTISLINQLYGEDLDQRIADLESRQVSSVAQVGNAAQSMYADQLRAVQAIHNVIDNLLINENLSPLSRTEQFSEAFDQFGEMLTAAQAGDVDAMNALPGMANTLLTIARDVYASGSDYTDIFNTVIEGLQSIDLTLDPPGSSGGSTTTLQPSPELAALYLERELRDQEQLARQRLELAQQLAVHLNDLAQAVNQPVLELANELGVNMTALVSDLGVNLEDLTVTTGQELASVSNLLGVSLSDLATSVGVDLGLLSQAQSIMNDALEAQINALPEQSASFLAPLLAAIESATTEADARAAIAEMEAAILTLPADQANLLAPFFDGIEYQSEFDQQLAILQAQRDLEISQEALLARITNADESIDSELFVQTGVLNSIDRGIRDAVIAIGQIDVGSGTNSGGSNGGTGNGGGQGNGGSPPQFAKGVRKIKTDQAAYLHAGETVLPAYLVNGLEKYGLPLNNEKGADKATIRSLTLALQQSRETQAAMMDQFNRVLQQIDREGQQRTEKIVSAIRDQQRTAMR